MDGGTNEVDHWREVAAQKEREWKEVTEQRINTLESLCAEKERQLVEEKAKFQKLKDDFKYNLRLLEERDNELDRYDASFGELKAQLNAKNGEVSECKIQLDEMQSRVAMETKSREELQLHYQARLREKQAEVDASRSTKEKEIQEERKEFESFKRKLQRQLTEVEEEMDAQKRELSAGFEDAMRRREHEFRLQVDEMSTKVLEYELKAKLLSKELDLVRQAQEKNSEELQHVESNHHSLEKRLKEKDWELQDLRAMKDASITDLQGQLQQKATDMKRQQEEFERKMTEMDKYSREKEGALTAAKQAFGERESELQNEIRDLQSRHEDSLVEIRRLQWTIQDIEKEKDTYIQKLEGQSASLKEKWDQQIVQVSRSQVCKDLELQNLRETEEKLKLEITQKKEDIERYKKELGSAMERESSLERSKAQMELDWQRRYEDLERQQYMKSEDLIKKLTRQRDEAIATSKERERELHQKDTLIRALQTDREQALGTLRKHGIKFDKNVNVEMSRGANGSSEDVSVLQAQNESLKAVIAEMRKQMEQLGHNVPDINLQPQRGDKITEDYVKSLEKECRELRQKNREMEQDADVARRFGRAPPPVTPSNQEAVMSEVRDNALVRNHIQSLNDLIGSLRAEKVELSAQVKKHQAHLQFQERAQEKTSKELREKQVELDQLQYELGATTRRSQAEIASLRSRISELELQVIEARKEADEYYRGNLERNMEVVALGHEVSGLKMDLAQKRPPINFGAQELIIQQLQDEILSLKQHGAEFSGSEVGVTSGPAATPQVQSLQRKLKNAAKKITELSKERQQLIEMGNKLRAEIKKAGLELPKMAPSGRRPTPSLHPPIREESPSQLTTSQPLSEKFMNKLSQLEKLQYQLTRQELQYAQRYRGGNSADQQSTPDEEEEYRPPSILKRGNMRESLDTDIDVRASVNTEGGHTVASGRSGLPSARSQLMMSMSSVGGESLQDVWRLLEDGRPSPTPRPSSPVRAQRYLPDEPDVPVKLSSDSQVTNSVEFQIAGQSTGQSTGQSRPRSEKKLSDKAAGRVQRKPIQKPKIRNYNQRDDSSLR